MVPFDQPFAARIAAIDFAVPDEPTACFQPVRRYSLTIRSISFDAIRPAFFIDCLSIRPSSKNRRLWLTQPMPSDSISSGSYPVPMTNSVEPPPTSTTSRRCGAGGRLCDTPR